jgi:hypothetical protein
VKPGDYLEAYVQEATDIFNINLKIIEWKKGPILKQLKLAMDQSGKQRPQGQTRVLLPYKGLVCTYRQNEEKFGLQRVQVSDGFK